MQAKPRKNSRATKKGRGRPPTDNPRTELLRVRVTPAELDRVQKAAARAQEPLADFVRKILGL